MNWIVSRVKEMSSWSGASLIASRCNDYIRRSFVNMLAWASVIFGA